MRSHVLPSFQPERIRWWLSLSGGKDSFAMAHALRNWYRVRGLHFDSVLFNIDQWHGDAAAALKRQISWEDVQVIEANELTLRQTKYEPEQQAPCRSCSNVRRDLTDALIRKGSESRKPGMVDFVARGLHLSDTAISALWRHTMGKSAAQDLLSAGKARPFSRLDDDLYLAKPLYYAREFECQQYARAAGHRHSCCGCPACQYPSRRDIVEESVAGFLQSSLWEFDVPGMHELLLRSGAIDDLACLKARSEPGFAAKHGHMPRAFAEETVQDYLVRWDSSGCRDQLYLDSSEDLDRIGDDHLNGRSAQIRRSRIPLPSIFRVRELATYSDWHLMTIATMGPFWGAIGLDVELASRAWEFQRGVFGIQPDETWSQVGELLRCYYKGHAGKPKHQGQLVQIG
jgi:tRNA(Ile)-lysidine synthase TilS/MesJ